MNDQIDGVPDDPDAPAATTAEAIAARAATIAPQRYRIAPYWAIAVMALCLAPLLGPMWPKPEAGLKGWVGVLCLVPIVAFFFVWLLTEFKVITVDATGLHVLDGWRTPSDLPWETMAALDGPAYYGYSLNDARGKRIAIPSGPTGLAILGVARRVRPDLWQPFAGPWPRLAERMSNEARWLLFPLFGYGFVALGRILREDYYTAAFFSLLAVASLWSFLRWPRHIALEEEGIRVRHRLGQRFVPRRAILDFGPHTFSRGIQLLQYEGRPVNLGPLPGGEEYALARLRAWLAGGG
jgi:hypothetical protein